jgi:hypothetical protein
MRLSRFICTQAYWVSRAILVLGAIALSAGVSAQITPGPGYTIKRLDGDNDVSQHFAFSNVFGNQRIGFYYLADRAALVSGACNSSRCSITSTLTSLGDSGKFVSAAALPGNFFRPLVAYYDASNEDLRAGVCSDTFQCSFFLTDRVLDSGGNVGQYTAMAINPATGFAVISYYVATAGVGDARVYACSNADCSAGSVQTIETNGDVGRNSAIAFGADIGNFTNLYAVYDNASTGQVRFARAISPFNAFGVIDLGAGSDPAISVGSSGFPDIVYRGADNSLKYVRCLSFDCSGANQVTQTIAPAGFGFAPSITHLRNSLANAQKQSAGGQPKLFITTQEPSTGTLYGILCNDSACANPVVGPLENRPGLGGASIASNLDNGRPIAFYHDAIAQDVRATEFLQASGATLRRGIAVNGFSASLPNVATRSDGRAVAIWLRERTPIIGICSDLACSSISERATGGGNTDTRPAIVVRPNGRPFAYYSAFGGTEAWDCSDANCTSGTARFVSGAGSSTSSVAELALRSDGIPVMVYLNRSTNEVFAYLCADINCTSGAAKLLATESVSNTSLSAFALNVGADNRPIVSYLRGNIDTGVQERRMLRCADVICSTASAVTLLSSPLPSQETPMALQSNGAPAFIEQQAPQGQNQSLVRCANPACSSLSAGLLPMFTGVSSGSMRFKPGDLALFDASDVTAGGYRECADASCSSATFTPVIRSAVSGPQASALFSGRLVLNAGNQPVLIFDEILQQDIWLALPQSDPVFKNGFEN